MSSISASHPSSRGPAARALPPAAPPSSQQRRCPAPTALRRPSGDSGPRAHAEPQCRGGWQRAPEGRSLHAPRD
eukprot:13140792-Alexandrium_andersonii.AAC.1